MAVLPLAASGKHPVSVINNAGQNTVWCCNKTCTGILQAYECRNFFSGSIQQNKYDPVVLSKRRDFQLVSVPADPDSNGTVLDIVAKVIYITL